MAEAPAGRKVSGTWVRGVARAFERLGLCAEKLCVEAGLDYASMVDPDGHVTEAETIRFWLAAIDASGDPLLGLHAGEHLCPRENHILAILAVSGRTLGDGLGSLVRYQNILTDHPVAEIENDGTDERIRFLLDHPTPALPHQREFLLAVLQQLMNSMTQDRARAKSIRFAHRIRGAPADYERVFECDVFFEQPETTITFDLATWDMALEVWDPFLRKQLEFIAIELQSKIEKPGFIGTVHRAIEALLVEGRCDLESAAKRLRLSERTLQRRLLEEGTSFRDILDASRRHIAEKALERAADEEEITRLTGFGSVRALRRAIRRWTVSESESQTTSS